MTTSSETRDSLIRRVGDRRDSKAWADFVKIYSPMIYRIARQHGLQDSDADDLTQSVLVSVCNAVGNWERDPSRAGFRSWLRRITRNATINAMTRRPQARSPGGS
ncbi:MAG: sigma-70 family RNA polymerase sigma factor, partial [Planctomycetota bacterium]